MASLKKQAEELGIEVDGRWSDDTLRERIEEARNRPKAAVNTDNAKIVPNIGVPRAQTSEEMRVDAEESGGVSQAAPYPGDPKTAHAKAVAQSERQQDPAEFRTDDLTGQTVGGKEKGADTVKVRLLYDWWDGQGVRHPLNSIVEMPLNDARNLVDQRKAERTDPMR